MTDSTESRCSLFENEDRCALIIHARKAAASLSFVGCFFIVASIILFQRYRNFTQRLILFLSVAALLDTIPYFMGNIHPENDAQCIFQGFWLTYFDWTVLLWVCCLTFNLRMSLLKRIDTQRYEGSYHLLCWGLPLVVSVVPLFMDSFEPAGAWCWIGPTHTALRFGIWYGPLFILMTTLFVQYVIIVKTVNKQAKAWQGTYRPEIEEEKALLKRQVQPLRFYPAIYLATAGFGIMNRVQNAVAPNNPIFILYLLQAFTTPMQGALNAVVYGTSTDFWKTCNFNSIQRALQRHVYSKRVEEYPVGGDDAAEAPLTYDYDESSEEEDTYARQQVNWQ